MNYGVGSSNQLAHKTYTSEAASGLKAKFPQVDQCANARVATT